MVEKEDASTVMFLIGNGFDIGMLTALGKNHKTTYKEFYDYLSYFLEDKENFIYKEIMERKQTEKDLENCTWMDYELLLERLVEDKKDEIKASTSGKTKIFNAFVEDWKEIQYQFADFLNHVIQPQTLLEASKLSGQETLECFIGDLSEEDCQKIEFVKGINNHKKVNYKIINFNYSFLADNYFYWLFDHHPYRSSTNNANFKPNPQSFINCKGNSDTNYSIQASIEFHHPHGQISIPESLLFGMSYNKERYSSSRADYKNFFAEELTKKLDKPYWSNALNQVSPMMEEANLYIIYGHSIGKSDEWWWKEIIKNVFTGNKEVIIYEYYNQNLKEKFLSYCCEEQRGVVSDKVYVVNFDDENSLKYAFNFSKKS
ncbi:AbiH family protein [Lactococcus garvieae]|uniref:AbiH family protein n=1 Tax=Lactococcus garvieae TaxID=1363 RepID=UPI0030CCDD63